MHRKRLLVAAILVPVFYAYIRYLPSPYFLLLLTAVSTIALWEFYAMARIEGVIKYAGLLAGAAVLVRFFISPNNLFPTVLISLLAVLALRLFLKRDPGTSLAEIAIVMLGLLYIPGLLTVQLNLIKHGPAWIFLLYAPVWAADSMAYYVGKGIGKRKLYAEISPNKTVAGAWGSVVGGVLGALLIRQIFLRWIPLPRTLVLGVAVGVATIIGDLVESMFKRDAGVKDSGHLLPGHGGVLDKIDGITFAGPVFYWLCKGLGLV